MQRSIGLYSVDYRKVIIAGKMENLFYECFFLYAALCNKPISTGSCQICVYFVVMYTLQTILQKLRQHKPELQRKYPVSRLGVFGSYARGEAVESSDIDIAVEITGPMGLNFIAMADEIEALFGVKTDVVPLRSIKSQYLPFVEKDIVYV